MHKFLEEIIGDPDAQVSVEVTMLINEGFGQRLKVGQIRSHVRSNSDDAVCTQNTYPLPIMIIFDLAQSDSTTDDFSWMMCIMWRHRHLHDTRTPVPLWFQIRRSPVHHHR
jgi:hypothetical protein